MGLRDYLMEIAEAESIYINKDVLRSDTLPESIDYILHRNDVLMEFGQHLKDLVKGFVPANMLVTGKNGTGKTLITNLILNLYKELAEKNNNDVLIIFIPCDTISTEINILRYIIREIETKMDLPHQKHPYSIGENFIAFTELLKQYNGTVVIIFDEADLMKNPDRLGSFSRIRENKQSDRNICTICITNDIKFPQMLSARTKSSLCNRELTLNPYDAMQLQDILQDRADRGLIKDACEESVIPLCAALAAQEHGDARKAIDLLRGAVEMAEADTRMIVSEADVRNADEKIEADKVGSIITNFPTQTKAVLQAVVYLKEHRNKKVTISELYAIYTQIMNFVDILPLSERRIADIISELDGMGIISTHIVSRGRHGRMKEIALTIPTDITKKKIKEDYNFATIDEFYPIFSNQTHL